MLFLTWSNIILYKKYDYSKRLSKGRVRSNIIWIDIILYKNMENSLTFFLLLLALIQESWKLYAQFNIQVNLCSDINIRVQEILGVKCYFQHYILYCCLNKMVSYPISMQNIYPISMQNSSLNHQGELSNINANQLFNINAIMVPCPLSGITKWYPVQYLGLVSNSIFRFGTHFNSQVFIR